VIAADGRGHLHICLRRDMDEEMHSDFVRNLWLADFICDDLWSQFLREDGERAHARRQQREAEKAAPASPCDRCGPAY
jgi:hypothetical protein